MDGWRQNRLPAQQLYFEQDVISAVVSTLDEAG
jgi:hypothetical protein